MITNQEPELWNFLLKRGDRWPAENFNVKDEAGTPITGFTVKMQIKNKAKDTTSVKELSGGSGFIISSSNVKFDANVDIPVGDYVHDIQITLADTKVFTRYEGTVKVTQDVTR